MPTIVSSPINRKGTEGLPTSPGAHSLRNRFAADSEPSDPKVTSGDRRDKRDERADGNLSPAEHHLVRHRTLWGSVR